MNWPAPAGESPSRGACSFPGAGSLSPAPGEDYCCICMDGIREKKTLEKCRHSFCRPCIDQAFQFKAACPVCLTFYGTQIGDQPRGGSMAVTRWTSRLPGYEPYGTIVIDYTIPSGVQERGHPNPGAGFTGTSRRAFLPDCADGQRVLRLLQRAFEQRLTFTVGTSATTGLSNVVVWNDVHHKTSTHGGPQGFGYPDPGYLLRVQEELRLKGITEDDLSAGLEKVCLGGPDRAGPVQQ
ncbi:probable E3 ubiquitin-protein ligase DTX3 [Lepisosteus oculatus]|uniref:probable E3 ubiquitin-protein ligase DTX3 n=1 Tax=Lepisosteus oculatus TaxID=7918 RepID=UPI0003EAC03A|nr:PREDICTED: probable E3 ubiquitin-protein ligase DTX3 [Lepisosteus oculatus]